MSRTTLLSLAGFQVITIGRFWVIAEDIGSTAKLSSRRWSECSDAERKHEYADQFAYEYRRRPRVSAEKITFLLAMALMLAAAAGWSRSGILSRASARGSKPRHFK